MGPTLRSCVFDFGTLFVASGKLRLATFSSVTPSLLSLPPSNFLLNENVPSENVTEKAFPYSVASKMSDRPGQLPVI